MYGSKELVLKNVEKRVFQNFNNFRDAKKQLEIAIKNNNIELAVLLSNRIGYHKGKQDAEDEFESIVKNSFQDLKKYL